MVAQAGLIASGLGIDSRPSEVPGNLGSDHVAFINAGVPAVFLFRYDDQFHTANDTADRIQPDALAQAAEVAAAMLAEYSTTAPP